MRPFLYLYQMAVLQPLVDLAEICHAHGIRHAVISPGSRSAALTLAFVRHGGFQLRTVMDERAAGFIALGMAQQLHVPVALICTSGSAAYNYAPAVAEAFFSQVPLLVLTADRPKEWIHQLDGQTIYQSGIYGSHVKEFFELPADYEHKDAAWMVNRSVNAAVLCTLNFPYGPVHINIPIREPFYPTGTDEFAPSPGLRVVNRVQTEATLSTETWHTLLNEWEDASKILIVAGQYGNSTKLNTALSNISDQFDVPVISDTISNQKGNQHAITHHDLFLGAADTSKLRPDLLITYGLSLISKELKVFLRNNPAIKHWHISEDTHLVDTFQSLTHQIAVSPEYFFENIFEKIDYQLFVQNSDPDIDTAYFLRWKQFDQISNANLSKYLSNLTLLNDLSVIDYLLSVVGDNYQLHVANSMAVRYLNVFGQRVGIRTVFSNRGTSGIDGCVSTAIGASIVNESPTLLVTGDVAFLYDRNGLLIYPFPSNLKIVILNNGGGNIFRMIDGPARLPELIDYFETRHSFNARRTAEDSGINYFSADNLQSLHDRFEEFIKAPGAAIFEAFTDPVENTRVWKGLKTFVKANW